MIFSGLKIVESNCFDRFLLSSDMATDNIEARGITEEQINLLYQRVVKYAPEKNLIHEGQSVGNIYLKEDELKMEINFSKTPDFDTFIAEAFRDIILIKDEDIIPDQGSIPSQEDFASKPSIITRYQSPDGPVSYTFDGFPFTRHILKVLEINSTPQEKLDLEKTIPRYGFPKWENDTEETTPSVSKKKDKRKGKNEKPKLQEEGWVLLQNHGNEEEDKSFWEGVYTTILCILSAMDWTWEKHRQTSGPQERAGIMLNILKTMGLFEKDIETTLQSILLQDIKHFTEVTETDNPPKIFQSKNSGFLDHILGSYYSNRTNIKAATKNCPALKVRNEKSSEKLVCHAVWNSEPPETALTKFIQERKISKDQVFLMEMGYSLVPQTSSNQRFIKDIIWSQGAKFLLMSMNSLTLQRDRGVSKKL